MKCPKCGYNSFEFLNACKKCGAEFVSFKKNHRISPIILTPGPAEVIRTAPVEPIPSAAAVPPVIPDSIAESAGDDFSWETSAEPAVAGREESPYSGFDLGFQDSVTGTQDKAFTGFSFSDEPADLPLRRYPLRRRMNWMHSPSRKHQKKRLKHPPWK